MRLCARKGFTLVEIMIVVAIIALLAAIAIPNMLRARHNANETAAIASLRTLTSACISFRAVNGTYPPNLVVLSTATPPYIDYRLGTGLKHGYLFFGPAGTADTFSYIATPQTLGVTGTRRFYTDQSGVIRLNNSAGSPIE